MAKSSATCPSLPKSVQVGLMKLRVICRQASMNDIQVTLQTAALGALDRYNLTIDINPEIAYDQRCISFLHEILHGCYMAMSAEDETLQEEEVVKRLAPVLLDVLRRNPRVLAYLLGKNGK